MTKKEMCCTGEYVHDPEGADVKIALGERRPANDKIVKANPSQWADAAPLIDERLVTTASFQTAEVERIIAAGEILLVDDPIVRALGRESELFQPINATHDEIQSRTRARIYNAPGARTARIAERRADAEAREHERKRQREEAVELRQRAAELEAAAAS